MRLLSVLLLLTVLFEGLECLRILAFLPIPWRSHHFVFRELVRSLGDRGHHVDMWTPLPMDDPPKTVNQVKVPDTLTERFNFDFEEFMNAGPWRHVEMAYDLTFAMIEKSISNENAFRELLRSNATYDIVITELPLSAEPLAYLAHRFNALNVAVCPLLDSSWTNELAGFPDNPSYMMTYQSRTSNDFNWFGRLKNAYMTWMTNLASHWKVISSGQTWADKHITYPGWESRPSLMEMSSDAALILMNSHPSMSYPYPRAPQVKEIGGIHIKPIQPLPKNVQEFMDDAPDGVIYFSLGTNVDANMLVENGAFNILVSVFKKLKQRVLWKVSPGMPEVDAPNIKAQTWYPQQDVLAHEKMVLFITHGGLQSTVETINNGVPILGLPVYFDQFKDIEYLLSIGMGMKLDINRLTEATLLSTINDLINNPRYREAAKKRQSIFRDRLMSPTEEAVYWIEYVGRNGKVLQPASAHMPFYQLYLIDVAALSLTTILVFFCILKCIFRRLYSSFTRKSGETVLGKKKRD